MIQGGQQCIYMYLYIFLISSPYTNVALWILHRAGPIWAASPVPFSTFSWTSQSLDFCCPWVLSHSCYFLCHLLDSSDLHFFFSLFLNKTCFLSEEVGKSKTYATNMFPNPHMRKRAHPILSKSNPCTSHGTRCFKLLLIVGSLNTK